MRCQPGITADAQTRLDAEEYRVYKETQAQLIRSPYVIGAALRRPGISQLSAVAGKDDPVLWLAQKLYVEYPSDAEVLEIGIQGVDQKEAVQLVNAVKDAYLNEVVYAEQVERKLRLDVLKRAYRQKTDDIKREKKVCLDLADQVGSPDSEQAQLNRSLALRRVERLEERLDELERRISDADMTVILLKEKKRIADETSGARNSGAEQDGPSRDVSEDAETAKQEPGESSDEPPAGDPGDATEEAPKEAVTQDAAVRLLETERRLLIQELEKIQKEYESALESLRKTVGVSADLEMRKWHLNMLVAETEKMARDIASLELNLEASPRIQLLQEAVFVSH